MPPCPTQMIKRKQDILEKAWKYKNAMACSDKKNKTNEGTDLYLKLKFHRTNINREDWFIFLNQKTFSAFSCQMREHKSQPLASYMQISPLPHPLITPCSLQ